MRFVLALLVLAWASWGQITLRVDASADRKPISPLIYGINDFDDQGGLAEELGLGVRRWGGNHTSRYNWKIDVHNAAADWYYGNFARRGDNADRLPDDSWVNGAIENARRTGAVSMVTLPMVGYVPKDRQRTCGFSVRKYGPQQKTDPYNADCGNGVNAAGRDITGNDPNDVSIPAGVEFSREWVEYLVKRYGTAEEGGVQVYALDNEPTIWQWTHRDVHPQWPGYDEIWEKGRTWAEMVKRVDPSAKVAGPVFHAWMAFFHSAQDWRSGWNTSPYKFWSNPTDRKAHGDVPITEWYLRQMKEYEQRTGTRLLDYLDLHGYVLPEGVAFGGAGDEAEQRKRLDSTRAFWDPTYNVADRDYGPETNPHMIRRMKEWVAREYPGTKLAITEYHMGAADHITGALAQADVLGIFGREGLDLATIWGPPRANQPMANASRMFLNFDGKGGKFGETSVRAESSDQGKVSIYAAERGESALTILLVNKSLGEQQVSLSIAGFPGADRAQVWRYSASNLGSIEQVADVTVPGPVPLPANAMVMLVLPKRSDALRVPVPEVRAVVNAASYGGIAPGAIVTVFGSRMGPGELLYSTVLPGGRLATEIGKVRVLFRGVEAPLVYVSAGQIAAIVPYDGVWQGATWVEVEHDGSRSQPLRVEVAEAAPGLFTGDSSGRGRGAILNQDGSRNGPGNPASRGSVVSLFATGEGQTAVPTLPGKIAGSILPRPVLPVEVEIGGQRVRPEYAGAAPGAAGLLQVNARIPAGVSGSAVKVRIRVGERWSQEEVTLSVRE